MIADELDHPTKEKHVAHTGISTHYEYATREYNSCSQMQRVIYKQCGCKVETDEGNEIAAVCSLG